MATILDFLQIRKSSKLASLHKKIDQLVYQLYELSDEEIKIVEGE